MFVSNQVCRTDSNLCTFLDVHLPQRRVITEAWQDRLKTAPWHEIDVRTDRADLGKALEVRIGLDLADEPGYLNLLGFLPSDHCRALLVSTGFRRVVSENVAGTDTTDPMLQSWVRSFHPDSDGNDQGKALQACLAVTALQSVAHKTRRHELSVETKRSLFALEHGQTSTPDDTPGSALAGLSHLWRGYVQHGRPGLVGLGERVLLSPELAPGFAEADLVIGRTLVEIKASTKVEHMDWWFNQVLAYLLVDRNDVLRLNQVALYLGWQGLLLVLSVDELLRTASAGATPQLADVRESFAEALGDDIRDCAHRRLTQRYPVPSEIVQR